MSNRFLRTFDYRVRRRIGEALLALANSYDRFVSARIRTFLLRVSPSIEDWINALLVVKKNKTEAAEESLVQSRLPDNLEIRWLGFCILEAFISEDFRRLERSARFFPIESLLASMLRRGRTENSDEDGELPLHNVPSGIIVKDKSLLDPGALGSLIGPETIGHSMMPSRVVETLPDGVLFIKVIPVQVLPSLLTIRVYVHLTADATEKLLEIYNARYEAPFVLDGLSSERILRASPRSLDSDLLRKKRIAKWKENLRRDIELAVRPFLGGYFSHLTGAVRGVCPTVDIYSLRGAPPIPEAMEDWKQFYDWTSSLSTLGWGDALGIDFVFGETYVSEFAHFQWGNDLDGRKRPVSQLVLWEEPCQKKLTAEATKNEFLTRGQSVLSVPGANPLTEYGHKMLGAMDPGIVVVRILQALQISIDRLRLSAFSRLTKKFSLSVGFRLINEITREALLLDRIAGEFRKDRFWPLGLFDLTIFDVRRLRRPGSPDDNFTTGTEQTIVEKTNLLKNSSLQVQKWLSESLSLRNTKAMFWLTVIAVSVAVVSVISGWESLIKLASKIGDLIGLVF